MNKDVLYIEPENDITDVIGKIKNSTKKVIVLVPPKKSIVLRSTVNLRLIAKTAASEKKVTVIATTDDSLQKLAFKSGLPVAATPQSRPLIPGRDELSTDETPSVTPETGLESEDFSDSVSVTNHIPVKKPKAALELDDAAVSDDDSDISSTEKSSSGFKVPNFKNTKKLIIAGTAIIFLLIVGCFWALKIAPSANVSVTVRATANNFSESVSFTTKSSDESVKDGIFLLEQQQLTKTSSVKFKATGQKNIGEKATGKITIRASYTKSEVLSEQWTTVAAGAKFVYGEKEYISTTATTIAVTKRDDNSAECDNSAGFLSSICQKSAEITVVAAESGENYNMAERSSGWTTSDRRITVVNSGAISGGTDKIVTVIQDSDIKKAKELLATANESEGKEELVKKTPEGLLTIESTFNVVSKDPVSTPKIGEEVKDDVEPELKAESIFSLYAVDKVRIEEFIKNKSAEKIAEDQKIYNVGQPFIERFVPDESKKYHSVAKIKTITETGPKITEQEIMEKSRGRKIGEVKTLIKSINGVSTVDVKPSFFWVRSVPDDTNKIKVELTVEK